MTLTEIPSTWQVLIVDDEPDNLRLASDLLEFNGATVARADDGQAALDIVLEFKPNLILLDLAMPKLDGWDVHRRMRTMPELNRVPIVALTALAMPADAERVRAEGFNGYITKPFRVRGLLADLTLCIQAFLKTIEHEPSPQAPQPPQPSQLPQPPLEVSHADPHQPGELSAQPPVEGPRADPQQPGELSPQPPIEGPHDDRHQPMESHSDR